MDPGSRTPDPGVRCAAMGMIKEFREFAARGNVIDLAVAYISGVAFGHGVR